MHSLVSKVIISVVVKFFKMTSPKAISILLHALTALIVIEFFLYKFVWNEGCVIIMYIRAKCEPVVKN